METLMEIRATLNHAGDQIAALPSDRWCGWICYLLEVLDDCTTEDRFCIFLQALHQDIAARLERGRW